MKYAAILFSLLFALTGPTLSATTYPEDSEAPDLLDITGVVLEITDESLTIETELYGEVLVHLTSETFFEGEELVEGAYVHVLNNGAMTRSIPPQITALKVGCYAFTGEITEIADEYFMLDDARRVNAEPDKLTELSVGMTVTVYSNGAMTMSIPPQIYGELIVPVA